MKSDYSNAIFLSGFFQLEHPKEMIDVYVLLNGTEIGCRTLTYYSPQTDILTGIAQIYMHQLNAILSYQLEQRQQDGMDSTCGLSYMTEVDRRLAEMLNDEATSGGTNDIPVRAFEQLFGIFSYSDVSGELN